jgi:hypothetical protein
MHRTAFRLTRRVGHEFVGAQEFHHQLVEAGGIFDVAGVAGLRKYFMYRAGDQ